MKMQLKKATRSAAFLKIGLTGPSGSGKTYSALLLAFGICGDWEKIAVIDTEHGSADLYSSLGEYNTLTLEPPFAPERYSEAIQLCLQAGMEVIVIDSASHEWDGSGGCLEIQTDLGGRYQDWARVTPRHRRFVETILQTPAHIIATTRTKTDHSIDKDNRGRTVVRKMGTKDVQRDGWEFELTTVFTLSHPNHLAVASKDRTGLFMRRPDFVITQETGEEFAAWSSSGVPPAPAPAEEETVEKPKKVSKKKSAKKSTKKKAEPTEEEADLERREMAVNAFVSLFETTGIISVDDRNKALEIVCSDLRFKVISWEQIENVEVDVETLAELYGHLNQHKKSIFASLFAESGR